VIFQKVTPDVGNMELGQRELSLAKARVTLWKREVDRLQGRLGLQNAPEAEEGEKARLKSVSRTFTLRNRPASKMANDLGQILLGRVGMEARPAPDNMKLTVTAPPDVLNRVSTFIAVTDWPKWIAACPDHSYPHTDAEEAARSFLYACSIEDIEGVTRLLGPSVLAAMKGTNLSAGRVVGEDKNENLLAQLRGDWVGKEAAVRRIMKAWNRFALRELLGGRENTVESGQMYYFAAARFEGAPVHAVELRFVSERRETNTVNDTGPEGPFVLDTLPPWWREKGGAQPLPP
jgi:hypothetical protein